jgi:hypothetical protein
VQRLRFTGRIAGFGTGSGVRIVVGAWADSPYGTFADVMLQRPDGRRLLLAPDQRIAEFVSATYEFDEVVIGPVRTVASAGVLGVSAPGLEARIRIGKPAPLDRLLRLVPRSLATKPWWLRLIDPIASRIVAGVHTAGTAGGGRREYYGVRRSWLLTEVDGSYDGVDLGGLAPLAPPVTFGFASAPETPQIVDVTTTIDMR